LKLWIRRFDEKDAAAKAKFALPAAEIAIFAIKYCGVK